MKPLKELLHELKHHVPFTILATVFAIALILIIEYLEPFSMPKGIFYGAHYLHILVSSMATAAIFHKYKKSMIGGIVIGTLGAILIGSLSDVLLPYLGSLIFFGAEFHLPLLETPFIIISVAIFGGLMGVLTEKSKSPHFLHVFLSVFASLFYMLNFTYGGSDLVFILWTSLITFFAVIIPCCISDIIFPFLFLGEKIKKCNC